MSAHMAANDTTMLPATFANDNAKRHSSGLFARFSAYLERREAVRQMRFLSDRNLADIGLVRANIVEACKAAQRS